MVKTTVDSLNASMPTSLQSFCPQVRRKEDLVHSGGFAAEYEGHAPAEIAQHVLHDSLMGIFERRYNPDEYETFDEKFNIIEFRVTKKYGTALSAICFVSYIYPEAP